MLDLIGERPEIAGVDQVPVFPQRRAIHAFHRDQRVVGREIFQDLFRVGLVPQIAWHVLEEDDQRPVGAEPRHALHYRPVVAFGVDLDDQRHRDLRLRDIGVEADGRHQPRLSQLQVGVELAEVAHAVALGMAEQAAKNDGGVDVADGAALDRNQVLQLVDPDALHHEIADHPRLERDDPVGAAAVPDEFTSRDGAGAGIGADIEKDEVDVAQPQMHEDRMFQVRLENRFRFRMHVEIVLRVIHADWQRLHVIRRQFVVLDHITRIGTDPGI